MRDKGANIVVNRRLHLLILLALLAGLLAACSGSPKSRAKEFVRFMPEEIGDWELSDTIQLLASTVSNRGHITLEYEGPDDALAYVVVDAHPSEDSADVAEITRQRDLLLMGLVLDADRVGGQATARVTQNDAARIALFQEETLVVEINTINGDPEEPVSDENFDALLTAVRNAFDRVAE